MGDYIYGIYMIEVDTGEAELIRNRAKVPLEVDI